MRIAAALAVCVLLASCGGGGGENSEAKQVRSTVESWLSSLSAGSKKGDNARACAYLTRGLQKAMDVQLRTRGEHATCKTYAANWTGRSTPPGRVGAHVTGVAVAGRTARVSLAAPPDRTSDVQLRKIDGRWRIDNY